MEVKARIFWLQKRGNRETENEDAYAPKIEIEFSGEATKKTPPLLFAIADGSSEGFFSRQWAKILVENFHPDKQFGSQEGFIHSMDPAYDEWEKWRAGHLEERRKNQPIKWFEEPGIARGAFSSFLGVIITAESLQAAAVGDSCLFLVRDDKCRVRYPLKRSDEFNNRPFLLSSEKKPSETEILNPPRIFRFRDGERLYLMTDALAAWFMRGLETNADPIDALDSIESQAHFRDFVQDLRDQRLLRNDDTTLMIIRRIH